MTWTVNWMYMILMTSLTGGVFTLIWYGVSRALERMGYLNITYKMLKVILIFWYCPFMYYLLLYMDRYTAKWGGWLFAGTPAILRFSKVFTAVWLCGVVIFILTYVWAYAQIRKCLKQTIDCDLKTQMQFKTICKEVGVSVRRTGIRQSYHESIPKVMGLFRQTIVIPVQEYSEEQLQIVLRHELTHVKHKDLWFRNLTLLIRIVHFMNPVMWLYWRFLERWSEFACDYSVCTETQQIRQYYEVIFSMMQTAKRDKIPMASQLLEQKSELRDRIEHVSRCCRRKVQPQIVAVILIVVMFFVSCGCVYAASIGTANISSRIYDATDVMIEIFPTELEEQIMTEAIPLENREIELLTWDDEQLECTFTHCEWSMESSVAQKVLTFYGKDKMSFHMSLILFGITTTAKAGIKQPDGTIRYIELEEENNNHIFCLDQDGEYEVFVQNTSPGTLIVQADFIVDRKDSVRAG